MGWAPRPSQEAPEALSIFTIHLGLGPRDHFCPGHEHEVEAARARKRAPAEALAQQPLDPVSICGLAHLAADREAQAVMAAGVLRRHHQEERPSEPDPAAQDAAV